MSCKVLFVALVCAILAQATISAADNSMRRSSVIYENRIPDSLCTNKKINQTDSQLIAIALDFLQSQKSKLGINDIDQKIGKAKINKTILPISGLVSFMQVHQGVPVPYGRLIIRINPDGIVTQVINKLISDIDIDVTPNIDRNQAADIALKDYDSECDSIEAGQPELLVYEQYHGAKLRLAWRVVVVCKSFLVAYQYHIDAHSGSIIERKSDGVQNQLNGVGYGVTGIYYTDIQTSFRSYDSVYILLYQKTLGASDIVTHLASNDSTIGSIATDYDNVWGDSTEQKAAVDAHMTSTYFDDWLYDYFFRSSYDNADGEMIIVINFFDGTYDRANWSDTFKLMRIYTPSTGNISLSGCPDVIAHEYTHGILNSFYNTQFGYQKEAGSVAEAICDMFGTAFERYFCQTYAVGNYAENWTIAEIFNQGPFRSLEDPHLYQCPDYYGPYYFDNGLPNPY